MKRWFLLLSISGITTFAVSQTRTYVGIKGGTQFSNAFIEHTIFNINQITDFTQTNHVGVSIKHFNNVIRSQLNINAGVQFSANLIERGWQQNFLNTTLPAYTAKLTYLEFPVEAILYFGKGKTKLFGTVGGYFELLVANNLDDPPPSNELGANDFFTYDESRDPTTGFGGRFSVGAFRDFGFGSIQLEVFSSISFSGFIDFQDRSSGIPDQTNLYSIGISVGYFFYFGKLDF